MNKIIIPLNESFRFTVTRIRNRKDVYKETRINLEVRDAFLSFSRWRVWNRCCDTDVTFKQFNISAEHATMQDIKKIMEYILLSEFNMGYVKMRRKGVNSFLVDDKRVS